MGEANGHQDSVRWDLTSYFAEFGGNAYCEFRDALEGEIARLGEDATGAGEIAEERIEAWAGIFLRLEDLTRRYSHLRSYVGCLSAAHVANEKYKSEEARMALLAASLRKALVPIQAALRCVGDDDFDALTAHRDLARRDTRSRECAPRPNTR